MKNVVSVRDIEELMRSGAGIASLPSDAIYTPSARDYLRELETSGRLNGGAAGPSVGKAASSPASNDLASPAPNSKSSRTELESYFSRANIESLKQEICEVGRRMWHRAYVDGNGGNIAIRLENDIALCTPTLVSKGFM